MTQSPEQMAATMIANLKEKTGKTLEEWLKITLASGHQKHGAIVKSLKTEHNLTHGFANLIAHKTLKSDAGSANSEADLVNAQYSGPKTALKPIYDALMVHLNQFGNDIEIAPKKAYVSVRRKKQFALVQPSTKTRVDVGINLKTEAPTERLEASGSFNAMVSHRVRLSHIDQIDAELIGWLKAAYEQS